MKHRVILKGGLGNQLFQFAESLKWKNTSIMLDWCVGRPHIEKGSTPVLSAYKLPLNYHFSKERNLFNQLFNPTFFARPVIESIFTNESNLKYLNFENRLKLFTYLHDFDLILSRRNDSLVNSKYLIGYFQHHLKADVDEGQILRELELNEVSEILEEYQGIAKTEQPVVLHMRIGDYASTSNFGELEGHYYSLCLQQLKQKDIDFRSRRIWLFSDSPEIAMSKIDQKYASQIRLIPNIPNGSALTLEIMRLGHHYVISNSSFSWWAATLSHNESAMVIAPKPWFKGIKYSEDLYSSKWILQSSVFVS